MFTTNHFSSDPTPETTPFQLLDDLEPMEAETGGYRENGLPNGTVPEIPQAAFSPPPLPVIPAFPLFFADLQPLDAPVGSTPDEDLGPASPLSQLITPPPRAGASVVTPAQAFASSSGVFTDGSLPTSPSPSPTPSPTPTPATSPTASPIQVVRSADKSPATTPVPVPVIMAAPTTAEPIKAAPALPVLTPASKAPAPANHAPAPVVSAAPAAPATISTTPEDPRAARMELAALHQVLFDVTLAITKRNEELQDLEARAGKAQAILDEATATQVEAASRHQEVQARLDQAKTERQKLDHDTEVARQRYEDLINSGSVLQEKLVALEEKVVSLDTTCQELETVITTQTTEKERVEQGLEQLTASLTDFQEKKRLSELEFGESLAARTAESDLARTALSRLRDALFETQLRNESLTLTQEEHQATIASLETQLECLTSETTGLEATLGSKSAALAEVQAKTDALTSSLAGIQAEAHAREEALTIRCRQLEAAAERAAAKLEQAEATLPTITTRHESLTRECQENHLSLQAARDEKAALEAELQLLKISNEEKAAERSALDRELMQTRRDLHELKLKATAAETEFQFHQTALEAALEKISAAHHRSQQALTATQTRHQDLLVKQDEALHELEQRQAKLAALTSQQETLALEVNRLTATRAEAGPDGPYFAANNSLESLKKEAGALEKTIAEKSSLHQTLSQELHATSSALAAAQETARQEHDRWETHRQTMEAEMAAHTAALQSSHESLLTDQNWHQDLSNRQSTALNDLNAAQAAIATLQAEAKALEKVIQERHSQKEALIEEIHRANNTVTALCNRQDRASASHSPTDESEIGDLIQNLMRLVDAADTAHAFIGKSLTLDATNGQFNHLREAITSTLGKLGIREMKLTPGSPVDTTLRHQIQVVKNLNGDNAPWIHSIISPGFIRELPEGNTVLLRKPEVIVSSENLPATQ